MNRLLRFRPAIFGLAAGLPITVFTALTLTVTTHWILWLLGSIQTLALILIPVLWYVNRRARRLIDSITHQASQRAWKHSSPGMVMFTESEVNQIGEVNPQLADGIRQIQERCD